MIVSPSSWQQTQLNTCGPACMMTALHELGFCELNRATELKIFNKVSHARIMGSTPSKMARFALPFVPNTRLLQERPWQRPKERGLKAFHRIIHNYLFLVYRLGALNHKSQGLGFGFYKNQDEVISLIGPCTKAICLVVDDEQILHFVLLRLVDKKLVVMDPATGENTAYDKSSLLAFLKKSAAGYWIVMEPEKDICKRAGQKA
jgi:hypothetical protein